MARVYIKQAGYYEFRLSLKIYDLKTQNDVFYRIYSSSISNGSFNLVLEAAAKRYAGDAATGLLTESVSTTLRVTTPQYYNWSFLSEDLNPYAIANPGVNSYTMSMQIIKLR